MEEMEFKPKFPFEALAILTVAIFGVGFGVIVFVPTLFHTRPIIENASDLSSLFLIFLIGWLFIVIIAYFSYKTHKVKIVGSTLKLLYKGFSSEWKSRDIDLNNVDSMDSHIRIIGKMIMSYTSVVYKNGQEETISSSGLTQESMLYIKKHFPNIKFGPRISKAFELNP